MGIAWHGIIERIFGGVDKRIWRLGFCLFRPGTLEMGFTA